MVRSVEEGQTELQLTLKEAGASKLAVVKLGKNQFS
jgi:ribosomal protein L7/L12